MKTTGILEKIRGIKDAVSSKDLVAYLTHYYVNAASIVATDGRLTASVDFECDESFLVPADEFEKALDIVTDEGKLTVEEDCIKLSGNRRRVSIRTLNPETFVHLLPDGDKQALPKGFLDALKALSPFMGTDATKTWSNGVMAANGSLVATNNVSIAASLKTFKGLPDMILPSWLVAFLLSNPRTPTHYSCNENHVAFYYSDGWVRSQLVAGEPPSKLFEFVASIDTSNCHAITAEWRDAFETIQRLCEDEVEVLEDKLTGGKRHANIEVEVASDVTGNPKWSPKYLEIVLSAATHWDLSTAPKPCAFYGSAVHGIFVGRN